MDGNMKMTCPICGYYCNCITSSDGWTYCEAVYGEGEMPPMIPAVDGYAESYDEVIEYGEEDRLNRHYHRYRWRRHHKPHGDHGEYGCK